MKIRLSTILSLGLAVGAGFVLFQTSQNVQQAEGRLNKIQTALAKEQDALRVLEAEWDYLNRPDRLEELARDYLKMEAQSPKSLVRDSSDLPQPTMLGIPARKPSRNIRSAVLHAPTEMPEDLSGAEILESPVTELPVIESVITEAEKPLIPSDLPMPAPVANDTRQQFDTLLNNLIQQAPSSGGGEP